MRWLFFDFKNKTYGSFGNLFQPTRQGDDRGTEPDTDKQSISAHYGWFLTLYNLSETNILSITGDKAITDLNFLFTLNFLSLQDELNTEEAKQIAQSKGQRIL